MKEETIKKILEESNQIGSLARFLFLFLSKYEEEKNKRIGIGFITGGGYECYSLTTNRRGKLVTGYEIKESIGSLIREGWKVYPLMNKKVIIFSNSEIDVESLDIKIFVSLALKYKKLENLRSIVIHDKLTNLKVRQVLDVYLEENIRWGKPFTFAIADIDHFKRINDTYGHLEGDRILKLVAKMLNTFFREEDIVVRWGGEEFAILLTGINDLNVVFKLFRALKEKEAKLPRKVTLSYGVITNKVVKDNFAPISEIVNIADDLLYKAKNTGRNKAIITDGEKILTVE